MSAGFPNTGVTDLAVDQTRPSTVFAATFGSGVLRIDQMEAPVATQTPTNFVGTRTPGSCVGDCDGHGVVNISDLVLGVNIALGTVPASACPAFENAQGKIDIAQIIKGVNNALDSCAGS